MNDPATTKTVRIKEPAQIVHKRNCFIHAPGWLRAYNIANTATMEMSANANEKCEHKESAANTELRTQSPSKAGSGNSATIERARIYSAVIMKPSASP